MPDAGQGVSRDRYGNEFFVSDNGGDVEGWCSAEYRNAADALNFVSGFFGPFRLRARLELVTGYVTDEGDEGLCFHKDADSDDWFWEIEAA
jgi:hypothetical protein